jgi:hypothetical protein
MKRTEPADLGPEQSHSHNDQDGAHPTADDGNDRPEALLGD